jgi:hypothetical protein
MLARPIQSIKDADDFGEKRMTNKLAYHTGKTLRALLAATALAAASEPASAEFDNSMRILLGQQLKAEKNCDFKEVLTYHELPLGDEVAIDGRASCLDGREYNFSRKRPHQKFDIELCEPTVC